MSILTSSLPLAAPAVYRRGDIHIGVWSIQHALGIAMDGSFGSLTEQAVVGFQRDHLLTPDGIAGPRTLEALVRAECRGAYRTHSVPPGSLESLSRGEAAFNPGAVNHNAPGGVDVGAFQRRVYSGQGPSYVARALRINYQARLLARSLRSRHDAFLARGHVTNELAWRLAVLHHNWPYAADRISRGYALSDKPAPWIPIGVRFDDGEPVRTYAEWAQFYSLGAPAHQHKGRMVSQVESWPP